MVFLRLIDRFLHPDDAIAQDMPNELEARQNAATTIISVVYQTAAKTFDGPAVYVTQTAGPALQQPATTTQLAPATTSEQSTLQTTSEDTSETEATTDEVASSTAVATSVLATTGITTSSALSVSSTAKPVSSVASTPTTASPASSKTLSAASAASSSTSPDGTTSSGGMSGGAKAGLALGLLLASGVLLALILCFYRRKKKTVSHRRLTDSEKGALGYGSSESGVGRTDTPMGAASVRTTRTHETAPRLSIRPVTQFLPGFGAGDRRSAIKENQNDDRPAMANHSDARGMLIPSSQPATSAWEKRGAQNNAGNPNNPFDNHAEIAEPSVAQTALVQPPAAPPAQERAVSPEITPEAFPVPRSQAHAAAVPLPESASATPKRMSIKSDVSGAAPTGSSETPSALVPGAAAAAAGAAGAAGAAAGAAMGSKGQATAVPVPVGANNVYRVQLAFKPTMDDEIELRAGAVVRMLHEYDDGWALCIRMDRSQQGVAPRTCLSKQPVKPSPRVPPSPRGAPPPHMRGPPIGPPRGPPRGPPGHMSGRSSPYAPQSGHMSPASGYSTPNHPMSPGMQPPSPYGNRSIGSESARSLPQSRGRSHSNAAPYQHYPGQNRSMSPGPYGQGQLRPNPRNQARPRSNSMGNLGPSRTPPVQSRLPVPASGVPTRKPVPGMAL